MLRNDKRFHVRRKDKEIIELKEIEQIIRRATVCHLGLVDNDEPYVVPVNFGYEQNALYFHSALKGRKIALIKKNNKVCFEIDTDVEIGKTDKTNCNVRYKSAIGIGRAYILESNEEKAHGLKSIMRQCVGGEYSFSEESLDTLLVIKIDIESITGKQTGY